MFPLQSATSDGTSDNDALLAYNSVIVFDNLWRDSANYLRFVVLWC